MIFPFCAGSQLAPPQGGPKVRTFFLRRRVLTVKRNTDFPTGRLRSVGATFHLGATFGVTRSAAPQLEPAKLLPVFYRAGGQAARASFSASRPLGSIDEPAAWSPRGSAFVKKSFH